MRRPVLYEDAPSRSNRGIGFFGLLAILFIGLKLTGYIDWSWWWITAPLWGPFVAVAVFLVCFFLAAGVSVLADRRQPHGKS